MRQIEYYTSQLKKAHAAIASKDKKLHNISVEMQRLNQQHHNIL
jgi:prefoldin subunit 5